MNDTVYRAARHARVVKDGWTSDCILNKSSRLCGGRILNVHLPFFVSKRVRETMRGRNLPTYREVLAVNEKIVPIKSTLVTLPGVSQQRWRSGAAGTRRALLIRTAACAQCRHPLAPTRLGRPLRHQRECSFKARSVLVNRFNSSSLESAAENLHPFPLVAWWSVSSVTWGFPSKSCYQESCSHFSFSFHLLVLSA